eukprot:CAMPEP_0119123890 /NCGR_PEP_ID=MMETSP1310-20130426/3681_1 /TAXON_ID=464262 /ORGANISM="Genus nov. species nov., Strain RCC2339" /LENGTH=335 /DNA_ID=CAMNT_0007113763 /DNA_START=46 /DNA_END=1053 /DNA_ORIENTATION=+
MAAGTGWSGMSVFGLRIPGFLGYPGGPGGGTFSRPYRCFSGALSGKEMIEEGGKVILPPSALQELTQLGVEYPMLFRVEREGSGPKTHCGVLQFDADEGTCCMPFWMMASLGVGEGELVRLTSVTLPKAEFARLQPHRKDFMDLHNPRVVMETALRNFATLTQGEQICIQYDHETYEFNVLALTPGREQGNEREAVSIIQTDVVVDFAPSVEEEAAARSEAQQQEEERELQRAQRLSRLAEAAKKRKGLATAEEPAEGSAEEPARKKPLPFQGTTGRRLKGSSAPVKSDSVVFHSTPHSAASPKPSDSRPLAQSEQSVRPVSSTTPFSGSARSLK